SCSSAASSATSSTATTPPGPSSSSRRTRLPTSPRATPSGSSRGQSTRSASGADVATPTRVPSAAVPARRERLGGRKPTRDWTPWVVGAVTAAVMLLLLVYPIVTTLFSSFVPQGEAISWRNLSFTNFERFFSSPMYQRAFTHSLVVSLGSTFFATSIALPAAYVMARVDIPI